jgi:hypothetical protein
MFARYFYNCFSLKSYAPVYSSNTPTTTTTTTTTKQSQTINNDNFTEIIPSVDVNINENFSNRQSPKSQSSLRNLYDHSLSYLKN